MMFVLAKEGKTYARLRFNVGPRGEDVIPVQIDFAQPFAGSDHQAWLAEYEANICPDPLDLSFRGDKQFDDVCFGETRQDVDPTVEQEELELLARTQDMSPDEMDDFYNENEVWL